MVPFSSIVKVIDNEQESFHELEETMDMILQTSVTAFKEFSSIQYYLEQSVKSFAPVIEAVKEHQEFFNNLARAMDFYIINVIAQEKERYEKQMAQLASVIAQAYVLPSEFQKIPTHRIPYEFPDCEEVVEQKSITKSLFIVFDQEKAIFYFKGKKINFPDDESIYVNVLKALFTCADKNGVCTYERIDKFLEDAGKKHIRNKTAKIKRIHNALSHLKREKNYGINNFPSETPDGMKVVENKRGKGIILNNPFV